MIELAGRKELTKYLKKYGWTEAKEIAEAYFSSPTSQILNALQAIKSYDCDKHDYTGELAHSIVEWEQKEK